MFHIPSRYLILSLRTAIVFELALDTNRPDDTIVNRADVERDVDALYHSGHGKSGKEKVFFLSIFLFLLGA
jgi:annexin A7/11